MNALIFHGTGGHPGENWFPWLQKELEARGCPTTIPAFPTPEGQSLEAWLKVFEQYKHLINSETILIAHSLGGLFLLRLLEKFEQKVKAAIFVGTPVGVQPIKNYIGNL